MHQHHTHKSAATLKDRINQEGVKEVKEAAWFWAALMVLMGYGIHTHSYMGIDTYIDRYVYAYAYTCT
jgi:hypothetical protein